MRGTGNNKKSNLTGEIFNMLLSRLMNFELIPGVRVSDEEVAKELGVSRTPVREALNRLSEQGLIQIKPNKGFYVKTFSKKEVNDLYILREALESLAIHLLMKNMTIKKKERLRSHMKKYSKLVKSRDFITFKDVDHQFHDLIAEFSNNDALYETLRNLSGKIRIIGRYEHIRPTSFEETFKGHHEIYEHIMNGDGTMAKRAMSQHVLNSMRTLLKILPD